ncbi:hypothetical protein C5688_19260 [Methylocystis sp. MitZ-2018]|nr:hypothetical protein C5688_19260 [Methylocystis sp. MitZ-2018]
MNPFILQRDRLDGFYDRLRKKILPKGFVKKFTAVLANTRRQKKAQHESCERVVGQGIYRCGLTLLEPARIEPNRPFFERYMLRTP